MKLLAGTYRISGSAIDSDDIIADVNRDLDEPSKSYVDLAEISEGGRMVISVNEVLALADHIRSLCAGEKNESVTSEPFEMCERCCYYNKPGVAICDNCGDTPWI